ncbi:2,3-butanediol dehydrogenase [Aerococcaceae bacterium DSM 111022]|nr:2,3-butanediol dehydrogenase [Aerococcaceae bacterium DSM 111022]
MRAARFYNKKDVRVEEIDVPELKENQVKIRVAWTGICGSDLHEYLAGPMTIPGDGPDPLTGQDRPITMGHEYSGVVEEIGSNVDNISIGDRVAVNPLITGGIAEDGLTDMYQGFTFYGLGAEGGFADYSVVDAKNVINVGDTPLKLAATVEPVAVAVQAVRESEMKFGESVAIYGAGPIGLAQILAVKAAGAKDIFVFDLSEERLEIARKIGATHAINSGETDPVEFIKNYYPFGVDRTFEVAGVPITLEQSIKSTRPRGKVTIVSIFEKPFEFNPMILTATGVNIASSLAYEDDIFKITQHLISTGQIDPNEIITGLIELEDIVENGFEELSNNKSQAKILVKLSGED